jgi:hypothetical protein
MKQIQMKDKHKVAGIELEFDPTLQKHFLNCPFLQTSGEAFAFPKNSQRPVCADFAAKCDPFQTHARQSTFPSLLRVFPKKLASIYDTVHRAVCNGKFKVPNKGASITRFDERLMRRPCGWRPSGDAP